MMWRNFYRHWQNVYYRQRLLDRKEAIFSPLHLMISSRNIERYAKRKSKDRFNLITVATLFSKGTSTISAKEEDIAHKSCVLLPDFWII